jgi:adenine deaminase
MRRRWVAIGRGDEPADLTLIGGRVLSVFTGETFRANVAIADGHIVGVGDYEGSHEYDVSGQILVPGFIDGHCHIESSKLDVGEFARAVLPLGTTSVVVDPHELANVLGIKGIEYILDASEGIPLRVFVKIPSCVPASDFESPAQPLEACDVAEMLDRPRVIGIAELMNYPAAIAADPAIMAKMALTGYDRVDGHAPGIHGKALNAYIVSGPSSDHECTTLAEALEKKRLGMWIMIREASMIRNLAELLPLVTEYGSDNCMFVTDDREADTLLDEGHMNAIVARAVQLGLGAHDAVKLATLNVARYHGLRRLGAVAPGYAADIAVIPDLENFRPTSVFASGKLVARDGRAVAFDARPVPKAVRHTVHLGALSKASFAIPAQVCAGVRVIDLVPDQVVTCAGTATPVLSGGEIVADAVKDLAKLAVIERHHATGRIGLGLVRGFRLGCGAFGSTVAHDAHNLVVAGMDDADMLVAAERLAQIGGGLVVVRDGKILAELPLEIAGLMSMQSASEVAGRLEELHAALRSMGVSVETPFMYLGFLALSVIPELRLTDRGLVDVRSFASVPLCIS